MLVNYLFTSVNSLRKTQYVYHYYYYYYYVIVTIIITFFLLGQCCGPHILTKLFVTIDENVKNVQMNINKTSISSKSNEFNGAVHFA